MAERPQSAPDVIVVGGGHNGLTCAAYLAKAGKQVLVLESRPIVGGFCTSEETVAEAPGFLMNPTSLDHVLTNVEPSIVDQLGLSRFGLRWVAPDPFYSYLHPDGAVIRFWRDHHRTAAEIRRISPKDAEHYVRFHEAMRDFWLVAAPYLMTHPTRPEARALGRVAWRALPLRKNLRVALRTLLSSPGSVIEQWFESEELKAALACFCVSSMGSLEEPGTGVILSAMAIQHHWGVRRPVGGNSAFSDALAAAVNHYGGEVRTSARVESIMTIGGSAVGVRLASGEEIRSDQVVGALDPHTLFRRMVDPDLVPEQVDDELRGMSVLRNNISSFRGDVALSTRPRIAGLSAAESDEVFGSVVLLAPSIDYVRRAVNACLQGVLTEEVPFWVAAPSVADRTLVPPESKGDSLYVYAPCVPYELADDVNWDTEKGKHLDRCLGIYDTYAPGLRESVIGVNATSPKDLTRYSDTYKGHLFHVDLSLDQFGPWRPTPSLAGYRTPIEGLWHTGAGAHPLGTLNGWSGRTTARTLLRTKGL
jgi:beta-carotene ketolase (CrtO type)